MTPRVSVIIPVKNRAHLLPATLDNVLAQTLPPYEVIVVDDGSTDDLPAVQQRYCDRVMFVRNEGVGPGAGRNTGLAVATGDCIQFFDSDDLMTLNKLEVQARRLRQSKAGMVYGPYVMAEETADGHWTQRDVVLNFNPLPQRLTLRGALVRGWNIITQACLFDRHLVREAGPWPEDLMTHEDYLYLFQVSRHVAHPAHTRGAAVIYRQHARQLTGADTQPPRRAGNLKAVLERMYAEAEDFGERHTLRVRMYQGAKCGLPAARSFGPMVRVGEAVWRLQHKANRMLTRTDWQLMHGVGRAPGLFSYYLSQIHA